MKKTQIIDILTTVKRSAVAFLSVTMFVSMAVAIFSGISWSTLALKEGVDRSVEAGRYHDLEIDFALGMTEEDLAALRALDGVDEIEGTRTVYENLKLGIWSYQLAVTQITQDVDTFTSVRGTVPRKAGEIAVQIDTAERLGLDIGDTITFEPDEDATGRNLHMLLSYDADSGCFPQSGSPESGTRSGYLAQDTFVVTAIVEHPGCLQRNEDNYGVDPVNRLPVNGYAYVTAESFDGQALSGYTRILVRSDALRSLPYYSESYEEQAAALTARIETEAGRIASEKSRLVRTQQNALAARLRDADEGAADDPFRDAQEEIRTGERLLADKKAELADAREQLEVFRAQLAGSKAKIDENEVTLAERTAEFEEALAEHREELAEIGRAEEELAAREAGLRETEARLQGDGTLSGSEAQWDAYYTERAQFEKDREDLANRRMMAELDETEYAAAEELRAEKAAQLEDAKAQYAAGVTELQDTEAHLADAAAEIARREEELAEAAGQLAGQRRAFREFCERDTGTSDAHCHLLPRKVDGAVQIVENLETIFSKLRVSMAGLFVLVGLLVCYFAILRLVHDQIRMIGTLKAIGFRFREILAKYLCFTGCSAVAGCVIGVLAGRFIVEKILCTALVKSLRLPYFDTVFGAKETVLICAVEIGLLLLVTFFAVFGIVKRNAVELLGGEKPASGKVRFYESFRRWDKLPLIKKTVINNFFTEKRRVFGTWIGIMGSTALIVTAFTLNDNILDSFDTQFRDFYRFDTIVTYSADEPDTRSEIEAVLAENGMPYTSVMRQFCALGMPDGSLMNAYLTVPEDPERFRELVHLEPAYGSSGDTSLGAWLNVSHRAYYGNAASDEMELRIPGKDSVRMTLDGYYECYLPKDQVYMSADTYRGLFGENPEYCAFLVDRGETDIGTVRRALNEIRGNASCSDFYRSASKTFNVFRRISRALILVYVVLAVLMSFLVLLNLLTMFVEEKKTELIVLMINGFSKKTAKRYISGDTSLLTVLGILGGIVLGTFMGNLATQSFFTPITYYQRGIDHVSILIGIAGTALLSYLMCRIALRRVESFRLSDINK